MSKGRLFFISSIITIFSLIAPLDAAFSYSSADVPVHHWSYDSVETLAIAGLVSVAGIDTKPMTRVQMAYKIKEAIDNIEQEKLPDYLSLDREYVEYLQNILYKLITEFKQELILIGATVAQTEDKEDSKVFEKFLNFNLGSPIKTENRFASIKSGKDILLENENGLRLKDGYNMRTRAYPWVNLFDHFTFSAVPAIVVNQGSTKTFLDEAAVKFSVWNVELSLAKSAMWWGPGFHGAMLISNNAEPLTLVRARSINDFRLPWVFKNLGSFGINFFISQLEKDRVVENPNFAGLRFEYCPFPFFTISANRTVIMEGKGRKRFGLKDYWNTFFAKNELSHGQPSNKDTDQLASFDARLVIPLRPELRVASGLELYGEWAGEDKFAPWQNESPGFLVGILLKDILKDRGTDFRVEYAKTKPAWYQHGIYNVLGSSMAYSYKDEIMGHYMGGDADDLFFRITKDVPFLSTPYFRSVKAGADFDIERRPLTDTAGTARQDNMDAAADILWSHSDTVTFLLRYEFEYDKNFNNESGVTVRNHIISAEGDFKF